MLSLGRVTSTTDFDKEKQSNAREWQIPRDVVHLGPPLLGRYIWVLCGKASGAPRGTLCCAWDILRAEV